MSASYLTILIILIQHLKLYMTWNVGWPNMTTENSQCAVGYDESQNEILMITGSDVIVYSIDNNNFTQFHLSSYILTSSSQFYTQINNLLYIIHFQDFPPKYYLSYFQLDTRIFTKNPHNTSFPYDATFTSCLTNWNNNYLIVIGGYFGGYLDDVAIYSISDNIWLENVPKLQQGRRYLSCMAPDNYVYVFGGFVSEVGEQTSKTIEKLDLYELIINNNTNITWSYNDYKLSTSKMGTRAVIYDENVYIIGGVYVTNNSWWSLSEVDVLNIMTGTVLPFVPLKYDIGSTAAIVVDDILYAFGGQRLMDLQSQEVDTWQYFDFTVPSEYEICVAFTEIISNVFIQIERKISDETLQITIIGEFNKWSSFGFGEQTMSGYAIMVSGIQTTDVWETILQPYATPVSMVNNKSFNVADSNINDGSIQTVVITRPYSAGQTFDFTDLLTCQIDYIDAISAKGDIDEETPQPHGANKGHGTLTRICNCTTQLPTSSSITPTQYPSNVPSSSPSKLTQYPSSVPTLSPIKWLTQSPTRKPNPKNPKNPKTPKKPKNPKNPKNPKKPKSKKPKKT